MRTSTPPAGVGSSYPLAAQARHPVRTPGRNGPEWHRVRGVRRRMASGVSRAAVAATGTWTDPDGS
jgi:hypothetical protein